MLRKDSGPQTKDYAKEQKLYTEPYTRAPQQVEALCTIPCTCDQKTSHPELRTLNPQVKALCQLPSGGVPATYLNSQQSKEETNSVYSELRKPTPSCKLLYVTPEQLCKNVMLQEILAGLHMRGKLARMVIDEVPSLMCSGYRVQEYRVQGTRFRRVNLSE